MFRYKITLEYDGTGFVGWQKQDGERSIQETLAEAVKGLCGVDTEIVGAGRTDAGVHALGQVAHFDVPKEYTEFAVVNALNFYLTGSGIVVLKAEFVKEDFHARFSAKERSYIYRILNKRTPTALDKMRVWHVPLPLNIERMQKAADNLLGYHDFSSFRAAECQAKSPLKTLDEIKILKEGDEVRLFIRARSFLHNQVRIITGTLVDVGLSKKTPEDVKKILEAKDRTLAGQTAPAYGLYLNSVLY